MYSVQGNPETLVEALISGHLRDAKKVPITEAARLPEFL